MKYEIYIKGCYERENNSVSIVSVTIAGEKLVNKNAIKFDEAIKTRSGLLTILPNKGQYQAELCALAWALFYITDNDAEIVVYSNNNVIVGWLNNGNVPEDYADLYNKCKAMAKGGTMSAEWIAKKSDNKWNKLVNDVAFELIEMKGTSITKIF